MLLRFLEDALVEYEDAVEYYERVQAGLGDAFVRDVEETLAITLELPEMGSPVRGAPDNVIVRRRLVKRFGVEINYVILESELVVVAIFHSKRHPGYWRDRLPPRR